MTFRNLGPKNRGQVWTADFITGMVMFIVVILVSVSMVREIYPAQKKIDVYRDAVYLSDNLLSAGYPVNWTVSDVIIPGVAVNNRLNDTQLSEFDKLEYYRMKTLLHTTSDFVFFIKNATGVMNISGCMHGYNLTADADCNPILSTETYDDLAKIDRMIIYNSTVVVMTLYAWN